MRTDRIVSAANILATAKLDKLASADKATLIKAYKALRKEAEDYEELRKMTVEKCKPEGFDDLHAKKEQGKLTEAEARTYLQMMQSLNADLTATLTPEGEKERTVEFAALSAEAMTALIESNPDLTLAQIDVLDDVLTGK